MDKKIKIAVIGGGAAGFFAAIHSAGLNNEVCIYEKTSKLLSKVKISGGGRCNVTHRPLETSKLVKNYPRGEKFLKRVFPKFSSKDTIDWFEKRGVALKVESDGRVFPVSDSSQSIINTLLDEANKLNIKIQVSTQIRDVLPKNEGFQLVTNKGDFIADKLIIAAGGNPKLEGFDFLNHLKHELVPPIPSLFTFNTPGEKIRELMGISFPDSQVKLSGTKLNYRGPVLITHWGISGPAVLKLSAFGAKWLFDQKYRSEAIINWNAEMGEEDYVKNLTGFMEKYPNRKLHKHPLFGIPSRFWVHLCERAEIQEDLPVSQISKKNRNKLVQSLFCYVLLINGKTTFKEEFVTSGGVTLNGVNPETMESKYHPNLFFAGEVLDMDGITGGFNFQAAWSTGFLAGKSCNY